VTLIVVGIRIESFTSAIPIINVRERIREASEASEAQKLNTRQSSPFHAIRYAVIALLLISSSINLGLGSRLLALRNAAGQDTVSPGLSVGASAFIIIYYSLGYVSRMHIRFLPF
jgi:hypothetical protein